ncbi:hypothetical protein Tcan_05354 [Toxocara canis]|uniref:Uncharacterized protein n=1 Tax=Toxocara canis TaxID=6265 RepID=A0A0B2UU06_TOXCA|nr:hypothetical protein Tcan_05354 [Toxocara canis]
MEWFRNWRRFSQWQRRVEGLCGEESNLFSNQGVAQETERQVMVEQVDDASCSRIPLLGSSCANHAPREHADGTSHLSSRGSLTSGIYICAHLFAGDLGGFLPKSSLLESGFRIR